ncbi:MAG: hypothetical protein AAFZ15_13355 [Bacteroidota bacterium]
MNKFSTLCLFLLATQLSAQSVEHYEKLAMASFYAKDFPTSLLQHEKIIQADGQHLNSLFFAGESARLMGDFKKAESYFERIPDEAKAGYLAPTDYHLGLVKQGLNKRDEAKNYYENYLNKHAGENELFTHLAQSAIHSLVKGDDWVEEGSLLDLLPDNINSEHAEMAPLRYADKLYFSSILTENYLPTKNKRKKKKFVQRPVTRIYEAQFNRKAKESSINPRSAILSASNITLMPDASRMYYTLCSDENPTAQEQCTIWYRNRFYDGTWGPAVKLPEQINHRKATNTQPAIGYDWALKKYVLYFVSDRPGGIGGKDIWSSVIGPDDTFGEPELMPVNTADDEATPFFHQPSQTLFFSSKGWNSAGGYDIFQTTRNNSREWKAPASMGTSLNSERDELYYTYHTSSKFAYFVSGEMEEGAFDLDIFEARVFVDLQLRTFNQGTKQTVFGAGIEIEEMNTGTKGNYTTGKTVHDAKIKLEPGTKYKVTVTAPGFQPYSMEVSTEKAAHFSVIEKNIFLRPFAKP